jgi:hypothetical protein
MFCYEHPELVYEADQESSFGRKKTCGEVP